MNIQAQLKQLASSYHEEIIKFRRHLHRHPELSFEETHTGKYIATQLHKMNIPFTHGIAGNGVVALIQGEQTGDKTIALRADIDALPIEEENDVSYKSKNHGVMHACGHDAHTASLLGAAFILNSIKPHFGGTIKLIFQPGEEKLPGGASIMIKEGVLENPKPTAIFGQHVHPPLEVGKVGFKAGMYMASADELYLKVIGKGGHGALPHRCIDPILVTAHLLTALQQVISRNADPIIPSVLTFGKIQSQGGATNVIPESVSLEGTFRTMDETWREQAHKKMKTLVKNMAESMGASAQLDIIVGYPFLKNDESLTDRAKQLAIEFLGAENVVDLPIRMTAEDFAWYSHQLPACFYRLGTGNKKKGITASVHHPQFDIDEDSLRVGAGLMAWLAYKNLTN